MSATGRPPVRCLLIEGIPGAGKTTTATLAAALLAEAGRPARWHLEEDHAHPVLPRPLLRTWPEPEFGRRCAASFVRFVASIPHGAVEILEGTTFQSTARLLWAAERDAEVVEYLALLSQALAPAAPVMLHLRPADRERHLREFVLPRRGAEWTEKLVAYVEGTERGRSRGWRGVDGLVAFWAEYGEACDAWCRALPFARTELRPDPGDWSALDAGVREWIARAVVAGADGGTGWRR